MKKGYHKRQELTMSELGLSLEELAGHSVPGDNPETFEKAVRNFLQKRGLTNNEL